MSARTANYYNNQVQNYKTSTKFCNFCKNAGKTESEYTSHFLRESKDPNSRIMCPTLLSMECRYCFKKGHTVSKCKKLLNKGNSVMDAPVKKERKTFVMETPFNKFNLLSDEDYSDMEDNADEASASSCMECSVVSNDSSINNTVTYASILARPYIAPVTEKIMPVANYRATVSDDDSSDMSAFRNYKRYTNWADCTTSDEEDF